MKNPDCSRFYILELTPAKLLTFEFKEKMKNGDNIFSAILLGFLYGINLSVRIVKFKTKAHLLQFFLLLFEPFG